MKNQWKTKYIFQFPLSIQSKIKNALLIEAGTEDINIELALNGRICDLEDTINIKFLQRGEKMEIKRNNF